MNQIEVRYGKIDQVAIYCPNIDLTIVNHNTMLGTKDWVRDQVTATGECFGKEIVGGSVGNLAFNYEMGYEFELLNYQQGDNWHGVRGRDLTKTFLSHKGFHVEEIDNEKKFLYDTYKIKVAQELFTTNHTNEFLKNNGRKYHYCVFDTLDQLGWDLKLIQRIEKDA